MQRDEFIKRMQEGLDIILSAVDEYDGLDFGGNICMSACKSGTDPDDNSLVWAFAFDADDNKILDMVHFVGEEWINKIRNKMFERVLEEQPSAQPLVLTCDGCRHVGTYDTDFPCSGCIRREKDYYEQER